MVTFIVTRVIIATPHKRGRAGGKPYETSSRIREAENVVCDGPLHVEHSLNVLRRIHEEVVGARVRKRRAFDNDASAPAIEFAHVCVKNTGELGAVAVPVDAVRVGDDGKSQRRCVHGLRLPQKSRGLNVSPRGARAHKRREVHGEQAVCRDGEALADLHGAQPRGASDWQLAYAGA